MFYLLTLVIAIPSPIIVVLNAEAWAVASGLEGSHPWPLVALALAAGQTICFGILYVFGRALIQRVPKVRAQVERIHLERFTRQRWLWVIAAALFGLPPLTALAVLAPAAQLPRAAFVAVAFGGRLVRFCVLGALPQVFAGMVAR